MSGGLNVLYFNGILCIMCVKSLVGKSLNVFKGKYILVNIKVEVKKFYGEFYFLRL